MGTPSFQAIHARRRQSVFVGRNVEVSQFRENLELAPDDERRRFIFNVFGQGGVGKTTLLQNFRRLAREAEAATAWTDDAETEVYEVLLIFYSWKVFKMSLGSAGFGPHRPRSILRRLQEQVAEVRRG